MLCHDDSKPENRLSMAENARTEGPNNYALSVSDTIRNEVQNKYTLELMKLIGQSEDIRGKSEPLSG